MSTIISKEAEYSSDGDYCHLCMDYGIDFIVLVIKYLRSGEDNVIESDHKICVYCARKISEKLKEIGAK